MQKGVSDKELYKFDFISSREYFTFQWLTQSKGAQEGATTGPERDEIMYDLVVKSCDTNIIGSA